MNRIILTIFISFLLFQCRIFKPSSLDPSEDIGSLQALLRFLALADAFNTQSQSVLFMKFTDSNGTPYANGVVEYFVYNEADENGVATSPYGESGNVQTYTATLDTSGRAFLFFSERGIANISLKNVSNTFIGTASFRIYNGITKQLFSIYKQTGNAQYILEDLANYRNRLATNFTFTPLGSANGRQFIYLEVQTRFIAADQNTSIGYIASSSDGEYYDSVTKIDDVTIEKNVTYEIILKISKPVFNGSEYVFFLSEEKRDYSPPNNFQSNRNLALRISAFSTPNSAKVFNLPLNSNLFLFRPDNMPWIYPVLYFGNGRYMIPPTLYSAVETRPTLLNSNFEVNQDMVSGFSCNLADQNFNAVGFQIVNFSGIEYLQCPISTTLPSQVLQVRSIDGNTLSNRIVDFNGTPYGFESYPFYIRGKFVSTFGSPPVAYTINASDYLLSSPTLYRNSSAISGFNSSINNGNSSSVLRTIKSSNNSDYFILSSNPTFAAPTIEIFRSIDDLVSVTAIPTIPSTITEYSTTITNQEQLQSFKGLLNYSYAISASTGVGNLPVFLTRFTKDDGTWESLPKLIKIK
ncbi:hypothetical protein EHQ71_07175 [Leptospira levettii]|uniref:hypothetical protein n=1 Tax=Leptospira levettii TaxID=2023178 RepID=UPI00108317B6|nr:hypothetical protein [Leptospira levettii]TGM31145.1 hypothetical protein EHQ71_07175 [Leptospira levettii]